VPPKFIVEVVTVSEFEEVAQTWFEKVNVPKTPRKVNIFM
jgi:hypothetical protein